MLREIGTRIQKRCEMWDDDELDVDVMNAILVQFCQQIQEETSGLAPQNLEWYARTSDLPWTTDQIATAKYPPVQASKSRIKNNHVILPTPEASVGGIGALTENADGLKKRWTGRKFQLLPAALPSGTPDL